MSPDHYHNFGPSNDTTASFSMGGQTPIFFAPSSFTVGHKLQENMSLEAYLSAKQQLGRGPLQMVDFKEVGGGDQGMQERAIKRQLRYSNCINYEAAEALTAGEDQVSMEDEGGEYGGGAISGGDKKGTRRLAYDQVKALEKAFEVENRLEPERKVRLASELGLQPRQVAVWFQNRRARWKTKQMERDFTLLKNKFEVLKADRDKLLQEKAHLQAELARLKGHSVESKQGAPEGDQDSPTLASCSLVVDDAPNQANVAEEHVDEAPPSDHQKHDINDDSLSSTEDSDNNNGAIEDSSSILHGQASSKSLHDDEPDFYPNHWRSPPPSHPLYKANIKNEGEWENGENASFSVPIDWYNW